MAPKRPCVCFIEWINGLDLVTVPARPRGILAGSEILQGLGNVPPEWTKFNRIVEELLRSGEKDVENHRKERFNVEETTRG